MAAKKKAGGAFVYGFNKYFNKDTDDKGYVLKLRDEFSKRLKDTGAKKEGKDYDGEVKQKRGFIQSLLENAKGKVADAAWFAENAGEDNDSDKWNRIYDNLAPFQKSMVDGQVRLIKTAMSAKSRVGKTTSSKNVDTRDKAWMKEAIAACDRLIDIVDNAAKVDPSWVEGKLK